ncbi:MAG: aminopeptidase P family protein [Neisseriaceae bacterium]|nr:aminopeptidase P family protein [Neisseriaceae bacterium]
MQNNIILSHLEQLREIMKMKEIDAWVALTSDPHLSEYIPDYWKTREFLSGFTGSAGTLVVTKDQSGLWTDSRYWEQAEKQLSGTSIKLFKQTKQSETPWDWLLKELKKTQCIGVDGNTLSYADYTALKQKVDNTGIHLRLDEDIMQLVWQDRPALPTNPIYIHEQQFVSLSCQEKITLIRKEMQDKKVDYHLVSSLDDIAWITNLRGSDVDYNPVFLSHLLIALDEVILFVDAKKINTQITNYLNNQQIKVLDYADVNETIAQLNHTQLLVDEYKVAYGTLVKKKHTTQLNVAMNPSTLLKAKKTSLELNHIKEAMLQDGIALCQFFCWLDKTIQDKKIISELDVDEELSSRRAKQNNFVSLSFNTIAGFNANSALPHYAATQDNYSLLEGNGILLIDSGGQYLNGTTDITRVVAINQVTEAQKRDFTLVLKSHIAMANLIYPEAIAMPLLDVMARAPLWQEHLDFGHGTGHGVGYFLNVHEGPQVLSCYSSVSEKTKVYEGMVTSIEPGLYRPGKWGVRIENLAASVVHQSSNEDEYGKFLFFDILTLCPIDRRLIQVDALTQAEKNWLNRYHEIVRTKISNYLNSDERAWLESATQAIS